MKVVIADDEPLVRYSLKSMLEELDLGLFVVAEATNGDELVSAVAQHQPDVCFVDIRMPGMTGLAAIRKARRAGSRARWIILTSHAEFDYASEALQLGVAAYLLKPAGPDNLVEVLTPVVQGLQKERRDASVQLEHALVAALGTPGAKMSDPPRWSELWVMSLRCDPGARLTSVDRAQALDAVLVNARDEACRALAGTLRTAAWLGGPDQILAIAAWEPGDSEGRGAAVRFRDRLGRLARLTADEALRCTAFAADEVRDWDGLVAALGALAAVEPYRCLLGTSAVHALGVVERRLVSLPPPLRALAQNIDAFLGARDRGEVQTLEALASEVRDSFAAAGPALSYLETAARYLGFRAGLPPLGSPLTGEDLEAWAESLVASTRAELPEIRRNADFQTRIIERVDQFLREHLETEVRVPDIASEVGLSPNYLSAVYSRLTGRTIIERLSDLRLDRAHELLSRPGNQVKAVASLVGYRSTRYFAQLYYRRFGHHPSGR